MICVCVSCKNKQGNIDKTVSTTIESICSDSTKMYELIAVSLSIDRLQEYFRHQKLYNQEFIAVDQTKLPYSFKNFTDNKIIYPVKFFTMQELLQNDVVAYVSFEKFEIRADSIKALLFYDIEGVNVDIHCYIDSCKVKLDNYLLWER